MKQHLLCAVALIALSSCSREDEMSNTLTSDSTLSRKNVLSKQAPIQGKWKMEWTSMGEPVEGDFFLDIIGNTLHLKTDKYNFTSNNFERGENDGDIIVKSDTSDFTITIVEPTINTPYHVIYISNGFGYDTFIASKE
ncbi:hypothetical protein CLU97_0127 [Chryseobacterium sp. 7]|uniref:hypothetical protein n=1 Tax=Chryseobacterium sp. 7 TaxID=2035214 RepID=UPI000EACB9A3|nr:hypothetical protein [Chryseobacterium sp. 7]RLJ30735.1 hypothetical protein CLU97_0127 [Chryseobacterium sp. 7]